MSCALCVINKHRHLHRNLEKIVWLLHLKSPDCSRHVCVNECMSVRGFSSSVWQTGITWSFFPPTVVVCQSCLQGSVVYWLGAACCSSVFCLGWKTCSPAASPTSVAFLFLVRKDALLFFLVLSFFAFFEMFNTSRFKSLSFVCSLLIFPFLSCVLRDPIKIGYLPSLSVGNGVSTRVSNDCFWLSGIPALCVNKMGKCWFIRQKILINILANLHK